jgi:hypothetical protein
MTRGEPARRAATVLRDLLGKPAPPEPERLLDAFERFERIPFDVPDEPDSDGFLFQYGPVNWLPEPTFVVNVLRQLAVADAAGKHGRHLQVQAEYRYSPDNGLAAVAGDESWWFRDDATSFADWLAGVRADPVWRIVQARTVREFVVFEDEF